MVTVAADLKRLDGDLAKASVPELENLAQLAVSALSRGKQEVTGDRAMRLQKALICKRRFEPARGLGEKLLSLIEAINRQILIPGFLSREAVERIRYCRSLSPFQACAQSQGKRPRYRRGAVRAALSGLMGLLAGTPGLRMLRLLQPGLLCPAPSALNAPAIGWAALPCIFGAYSAADC